MRIFKKNSVMYLRKSIFPNLISSIFLRLRIAYALQYEYKYEYEYEYIYECVIPHSGGMRIRRAVSAKERKMNFRFCFLVRASHLTGQTQNGLSPNPYTNRKSKHTGLNLVCLLFFCWFQLRVMRLALLAVMSLLRKRYDMIAHQFLNLAKPIITMRSIS